MNLSQDVGIPAVLKTLRFFGCFEAYSLDVCSSSPFFFESQQEILLTAVDLQKLEKLEIGGVRGRVLSHQVQSLHHEFVDTYKLFTEKPHDCLELNNKVRALSITWHTEVCSHPSWGKWALFL